MRTRPEDGRGVAKKWSDDELKSKKSWTSIISIGLWEEVLERINLSGEYPKGTQTAVRHVTYSAYINKVVETIRLTAKPRFRTDTEIFRIAIHIGITFMYFIFCVLPESSKKKARGHFFYEALGQMEKKMERATMVIVAREKSAELLNLVKQGGIDAGEAQEEMDKLLSTLDSADGDYVRHLVISPKADNVKMLNEDLLKKIMSWDS